MVLGKNGVVRGEGREEDDVAVAHEVLRRETAHDDVVRAVLELVPRRGVVPDGNAGLQGQSDEDRGHVRLLRARHELVVDHVGRPPDGAVPPHPGPLCGGAIGIGVVALLAVRGVLGRVWGRGRVCE